MPAASHPMRGRHACPSSPNLPCRWPTAASTPTKTSASTTAEPATEEPGKRLPGCCQGYQSSAPTPCVYPARASRAVPEPVQWWVQDGFSHLLFYGKRSAVLSRRAEGSARHKPREAFSHRTYLPSLLFIYLKIFLITCLCAKGSWFTGN